MQSSGRRESGSGLQCSGLVWAMMHGQQHTGKDAWWCASLFSYSFPVNPSADRQPGAQIAECCDSFQHSVADGNLNGGLASLVHDCSPLQAEHQCAYTAGVCSICMPFADALWECKHQQPLDYNQKVSSKG